MFTSVNKCVGKKQKKSINMAWKYGMETSILLDPENPKTRVIVGQLN